MYCGVRYLFVTILFIYKDCTKSCFLEHRMNLLEGSFFVRGPSYFLSSTSFPKLSILAFSQGQSNSVVMAVDPWVSTPSLIAFCFLLFFLILYTQTHKHKQAVPIQLIPLY